MKKLRNCLLLQTVTDAWALSLSGVHAYPFTSHQSSFLFYIFDQLISVLKLVWLIFKLLFKNYLDGKEWMIQWEETTFPVTVGLWFLNYYVDNYSRWKLAYLPFILNKPSFHENFISWNLPRELQHMLWGVFRNRFIIQ